MLTFKELYEQGYISEAIHQELKGILKDADSNDNEYSRKQTLNKFSKKLRELSKRGEDNGLLEGKPKKGSSRAVFFPKENRKIHIDNVETEQPTAVKIAFPGSLDKYTGSDRLLGEHQNEVESSNFTNKHHSVLSPSDHGSEHYHYNPEGVTAPVFEHGENHNWLEMGKADKMSAGKFKELTKTESHPKGLNFNHFTDALMNDHMDAHGMSMGNDDYDHIREHPLYENTQNFIQDTNNHPGDLRLQNYGVWKHPITGKEHPVIRDFGYSNDISKLYSKARQNLYKSKNS